MLSLLILILLSAAIALSVTACDDDSLGTGEKQFTFEAHHADGTVNTVTVNTDKSTVGEALIEIEMISGEEGPYGLMVMTVDGETHKYEDDGKYWAFYINGEYAMSGVDTTEITDGATYAFKVE